jgi:hypothetical protein
LSAKKQSVRDRKIDRARKTRKRPGWPFISRFKDNELRQVIEFIKDSNSNYIMREVLKKYLIIACVSLIEESLTRLARKTIEDKKIPISAFGGEISKEFIQWVMRGGKASIGVFAATSYYLAAQKASTAYFPVSLILILDLLILI